MTPERRTKLLHRLCLFAPLLSAASIVLLALPPMQGLVQQVSQLAPSIAPSLSVIPALGWFMLTLGCSAVTALDFARRWNKSGTSLVMLVIFGTGLVFCAHVLVIGTLAFAGCVIAYRH